MKAKHKILERIEFLLDEKSKLNDRPLFNSRKIELMEVEISTLNSVVNDEMFIAYK